MAIKVYSPIDFEDTSSGLSIDGDFAVDTNTLFVDVSTNRVGIRTTSPAHPLHVIGDAYIQTGNIHISQGSYRIKNASAGTQAIGFPSSGNFTFENVNVGIGTTSPSQKVHITASGTNPYIRINESAFTGIDIGQETGNGNGIINLRDNANLRVFTNATERMRITSGGNVLIGTTTDGGDKLQVSGDISAQGIYVDRTHESGGISNPFAKFGLHHWHGNSNTIYLQKSGRTQYFQFNTQSGYFQVSDGTNYIILRGESTSEVSVYSSGALNYVQHSASTNNNGNVLTWDNSTSGNGQRGRVSIVGDLRLDDYSSGSASNTVNIENNGDAYFSGSLGIGTSNPGEKLEIAGRLKVSHTSYSAFIGAISASWAGNTNYPTLYGSDAARWVMHINPHISYVANGVNGYTGSAMTGATVRFASNTSASTYWDLGVGTNSVGSDKFSIGRAGSPLLNITSTGNVLIGTTVDNGSGLRVFSTGNGELEVERSGGAQINLQAQAARGVIGTDSNHELQLKTNSTARVTINTAGRVGIGTSSPAYPLHAYGHVGISDSDDSARYRFIVDDDGINSRFRIRREKANGSTSAANDLTIVNGNVGIGTSSPDRQIQVHESTSGTSTAKFTNSTTGEDGDTGFFVGINGSEQPILFGYNSTDMVIGTNASERMRITSGGNVLIGKTTDAGYKIDINGTARILNDVKITANSGAEGNTINLEPSNAIAEIRTDGESTSDEAGVYLGTPYTSGAYTAPTKAAIIAQGVGTYSRSKLLFCLEDTASNSESAVVTSADAKMELTRDGKLGVNKTSPNYEVDSAGDINADGDFYQNGTQGWTGTINISTNPPVAITVNGGIITNVT